MKTQINTGVLCHSKIHATIKLNHQIEKYQSYFTSQRTETKPTATTYVYLTKPNTQYPNRPSERRTRGSDESAWVIGGVGGGCGRWIALTKSRPSHICRVRHREESTSRAAGRSSAPWAVAPALPTSASAAAGCAPCTHHQLCKNCVQHHDSMSTFACTREYTKKRIVQHTGNSVNRKYHTQNLYVIPSITIWHILSNQATLQSIAKQDKIVALLTYRSINKITMSFV